MASNQVRTFAFPTEAVQAQDDYLSADGIQVKQWKNTVFLPLTLVANGRPFTLQNSEGLNDHLKALESKSLELGVAKLRTQILSCAYPAEDIAIISSIRDRLSRDGKIIGSSSITWSVIRVDGNWRINQILFNDSIRDPSVVAQTFLGYPNKAEPLG